MRGLHLFFTFDSLNSYRSTFISRFPPFCPPSPHLTSNSVSGTGLKPPFFELNVRGDFFFSGSPARTPSPPSNRLQFFFLRRCSSKRGSALSTPRIRFPSKLFPRRRLPFFSGLSSAGLIASPSWFGTAFPHTTFLLDPFPWRSPSLFLDAQGRPHFAATARWLFSFFFSSDRRFAKPPCPPSCAVTPMIFPFLGLRSLSRFPQP